MKPLCLTPAYRFVIASVDGRMQTASVPCRVDAVWSGVMREDSLANAYVVTSSTPEVFHTTPEDLRSTSRAL